MKLNKDVGNRIIEAIDNVMLEIDKVSDYDAYGPDQDELSEFFRDIGDDLLMIRDRVDQEMR